MHTIDWVILVVVIVATILFGLVKGKHSKNLKGFFLSDQNLNWYSIGLSVIATQASAITFLSAPGQAFDDGLRFIQFYLGLPLAMIFIISVLVPLYKKHDVFTAYQFLEKRFDLKTRVLGASLFLIQRGLAVGFTIYAPALVLSNILGWNVHYVSILVGALIIVYTVWGGTRAVSFSHKIQLGVILLSIVIAFYYVLGSMPASINTAGAWEIAKNMGKINPIDFEFDLNQRYNVWSGLIGGFFLALAYFGTDQSQVQRYLSGKSAKQAKLGLLFNGITKIPLQLFILLLGVFLFVMYQFKTPNLVFSKADEKVIVAAAPEQYAQLKQEYNTLHLTKSELLLRNMESNSMEEADWENINAIDEKMSNVKAEALGLVSDKDKLKNSDLDQMFIHFVVEEMPVGLVGLIIAAIICASMSSAASILNALSATSTIDIYKRLYCKKEEQKIDLRISKWITVFWGVFGVLFSMFAHQLGNLIQAVNILGSLFYGSILGIFMVGVLFKRIKGTSVFVSAILVQIVVFYCFFFTQISYLWFNVIGCVMVVLLSVIIELWIPAITNARIGQNKTLPEPTNPRS